MCDVRALWMNKLIAAAWSELEPVWAETVRSALDGLLAPIRPKYIV
jgi:hypothetical protein